MGRVRGGRLPGVCALVAAFSLSGCGGGILGIGGNDDEPAAPAAAATSPSLVPSGSSRPPVPLADARFSFVSLTGAPSSVITRISSALGRETVARGLKLAPSGDPTATYVIKGYLSAVGDASGTIVVYVWDIFDAQGRRLHRVSGQETVAASSADPWGAVDGAAVDAIARRTIEGIAAWGGSATG